MRPLLGTRHSRMRQKDSTGHCTIVPVQCSSVQSYRRVCGEKLCAVQIMCEIALQSPFLQMAEHHWKSSPVLPQICIACAPLVVMRGSSYHLRKGRTNSVHGQSEVHSSAIKTVQPTVSWLTTRSSSAGMSPLLRTNSAVSQSMKNNPWIALKSYQICFLNLHSSVKRPSAVWTSFQYLRRVEVRLLDREEPSTRMAQILKTPPLVPSTAQPGQVLQIQLVLQLPINHLQKQMEVLRKPLKWLEKLPHHFLQV
mmetsp:Transcript_2175/g.14389  ORF Transcript_2175/g.14389 Transcript_2175/m.14389 type:complete len:253 (-) Transcript_2175:610-1368(-)